MSIRNNKIKNHSKNPIEAGYLSLQEACKLLPYSQEYLSLLARRGKINAKKFGRNWYITKEAGEDYLKKQGISIIIPKEFFPSYSGRITKPVLTPFYLTKEEMSQIEVPKEKEKEIITEEEKETKKAEHEIELERELERELIEPPQEKIIYTKEEKIKKFPRLGLVTALFIFLFFIVTFAFYIFTPQQEKIAFHNWLKEKTSNTIVGLKNFVIKNPEEKKLSKGVKPGDIFLFEREFGSLEENIIGDVKVRFGGFRQTFGLEKPGVEEKENGVVIVPKNLAGSDLFKKELEMTFADNVEVEPDESGKAGIIKPVFAAPPPTEQSYLYMMVPVEEKKTP